MLDFWRLKEKEELIPAPQEIMGSLSVESGICRCSVLSSQYQFPGGLTLKHKSQASQIAEKAVALPHFLIVL